MKNIVMMLVPSIALMACKDSRTPYYDDEGSVTISGLSLETQDGNMGGLELEISGSGFGDDASSLTVMFGNQNADVLSASDGSLMVIVPHGPVGGGAVDIRVGNASGRGIAADGFIYALPGNGMEPVYGEVNSENQIAYVAIANDMMSCYGGTGLDPAVGCSSFAYTGSAGIEGRSEGLEITYPGAESPYALGKGGFANDTSVSWQKWNITTTPHDVVSFDDENAVKNFRLEIGEFYLENSAKSGDFCANLPSAASFTYNGESEFVPTAVNSFTNELENPELAGLYLLAPSSVNGGGDFSDELSSSDCEGDDKTSKSYELDKLQFCMTKEYEEGDSLSYASEWPIADNFFMTQNASGQMVADEAIPVTLNIGKARINQVLNLPPYAAFTNTLQAEDDNPDLWAVTASLDEECPDSDNDRLTSSSDAIFNWAWEPVDWQADCSASDGSNGYCVEVPDGVNGVNSYVKVTISYFSLSWMGGEGVTQQATIVVPDNSNFDAETGLSNLELPSWVMYSFPSGNSNFGEQAATLGEAGWNGYAGTSETENALIVFAMDRVVEFTIPTSIETQIGGEDEVIVGDLVFAYSTGDMGFFSFDNPLDSIDPCDDCMDNDGDGWVDALDPDCMGEGTDEDGSTQGDSTCNNDSDDDNDGLVDAEDPDCINGAAGESFECSNGIDDDEDGWVDQADPDCQAGADIFERNDTYGVNGCNDGLDNDGDGWIDIEDLGCEFATNAEDDGFADIDEDGTADFECNDGIDNDGWGDIDSDDINCSRRGPDGEEAPEMQSECTDEIDNDGDGYIDDADPACEMTNGNRENPTTYDNTDPEFTALGDCNDGIDNDCDGLIDIADPACADGNAYISSEADDGSLGSCNCGDELDNDADGWVDLEDPDCRDGDGNPTEFAGENGYLDADQDGNPDFECNDGIDNDGDGLTDALDVYCWERSTGAFGETEEPSSPGAACTNGTDDDADGWIDFADPSCDKTNGNNEGADSTVDLEHWGNPECINGVDDDADGLIDADDCNNWYDATELDQ